MSILSGMVGSMKKKGPAGVLNYQVPGTFNSKTYYVANKALGEPNAGEFGVQWKTTNTDSGLAKFTTAATALTNLNGLSNSNAINNTSHPAAQFCRNLSIGSYGSVWFLPSAGELNHIYQQLSTSGKLLAPGGTHVDKFTGAYYWSSTEFSGANAWGQNMSGGGQDNAGKDYTWRVRAARAV